MAYQTPIVKQAGWKYRWPSWFVYYDQNFRQEAAGNATKKKTKMDPSIYHAQCFAGQAISAEIWCCRWPYFHQLPIIRKRSAMGAAPPGRAEMEPPVCIKFNKFNGDCKFGRECCFLHVCSSCLEADPVSRCPKRKCHSTRPGSPIVDNCRRGRLPRNPNTQ